MTVILLSGCDLFKPDSHSNLINTNIFSSCENTFVVSGSRKIYLFEHQPQRVEFKQLAVFDDWAPLSAFLDCDNNRIIVPYGARKENRNNAGVAVIDLDAGKKIDHPLNAKGIQGIPVKYDSGLLLSTTLLNQTKPLSDPPVYQYIPPGEQYEDSQGSSYRLYASTVFFDLTQLEFTKNLDLDLGYSVVDGHKLYAKQRGAITAIDLQSKTTDVLYEAKNNIADTEKIPSAHLGVFLNGHYYMVLNRYSKNTSDGKLIGFESNAIYKLVDGSMVKLSNYSSSDAVYLIGVENKLYLFTKSLKVIEYDIALNSIVERTLKPLNDMSGYSIESVGYTHQNFILALDSQRDGVSSQVILISRDFSQVSSPQAVDLRLISVASDLAIDTADSRGF